VGEKREEKRGRQTLVKGGGKRKKELSREGETTKKQAPASGKNKTLEDSRREGGWKVSSKKNKGEGKERKAKSNWSQLRRGGNGVWGGAQSRGFDPGGLNEKEVRRGSTGKKKTGGGWLGKKKRYNGNRKKTYVRNSRGGVTEGEWETNWVR